MNIKLITSFVAAASINTLGLLTSPLALGQQNVIETELPQERWFEIEVILFKQVTTSSENQEEFFANNLDYKKQRALDLLAPYLQPDISGLKQLLPSCDPTGKTGNTYLWQSYSPKIELPQPELWVDNIQKIDDINTTDKREALYLHNDDADEDVLSNEQGTNTAAVNSANMSVTVTSIDSSSPEFIDTEENENNGDVSHALARQAQTKYQKQYAEIILDDYTRYPASYLSSEYDGICTIPTELLVQQLSTAQLKNFNADGFPIDKMPTIIDGLEQWQDDENGEITWASKTPYLISQDSFKLKSIANRIKKSRDFKPLLHVAWRQVGESRRQAKAMRLYAGDHLSQDYQQALIKHYEQQREIAYQIKLEQEKEAQLAEVLNNQQVELVDYEHELDSNNQPLHANSDTALNDINDNVPESSIGNDDAEIEHSQLSAEDEYKQQAVQQQLDSIYAEYSQLPEALPAEETMEDDELGNPQTNDKQAPTSQYAYNETDLKQIISALSSDINAPKQSFSLSDTAEEIIVNPPQQPWFLDGVFKVHLDHYLYINSEFNLLNKYSPSSESATKIGSDLGKDNIITFKQDRRVITGEIHYFDHPHMGMVVQIRRFDPTIPAAEAVTQSKK